MPVLDLQNKVGILQLCSACTFSLLWVSIANENRAGTGGGITVFQGQTGSRVDWLGGNGLRKACPPARPQLQLINITQRSIYFPTPPGGQLAELVNVTYRVSCLQSAPFTTLVLHRACMHAVDCHKGNLLSSQRLGDHPIMWHIADMHLLTP